MRMDARGVAYRLRGRAYGFRSNMYREWNGGLKKSVTATVLLAAAVSLLILLIRGCGLARSAAELYGYDIYSGNISEVETAPAPAGEQRNDVTTLISIGKDSESIVVSIDGMPHEMDFEEYLIGVVAAEMPASFEPEALKAQAVAARTYAALHIAGNASCKRGYEGCDVCDDNSCCQAYMTTAELSAFWGASYEKNIERVRQAVGATEGIVAVYDGDLISAVYHASSSGATENSEAVFAMALPYLVSVDSHETDSARSDVKFSLSEFANTVNNKFSDAQLSSNFSADEIDIWGRTDSGRVQLIRLGGTVITGQQFRTLFSLKSANFTVESDGQTITISCKGYGHGVGMSQYGANEMAKNGSTFAEILTHFYKGTELARIG